MTKISIVKSHVCDLAFAVLRFARKISYWLSLGINHFSVFHLTVYYQEVVLFISSEEISGLHYS